MTTTQRTPWTPYDDDLKKAALSYETQPAYAPVIINLMAKQEGYLRAHAEAAPLLEALKRVQAFAKAHPYTGVGDSEGYPEGQGLRKAIKDALDAQAEKGGQPQ